MKSIQPRRTHWTSLDGLDEPLPPVSVLAPVASQPSLAAPAASRSGLSSTAAQGLAGVLGQWWRARTQPARQMRVLETLALGPKRSVALFEVNGQRFLAGMGADGVSTLLAVGNSCAGDLQ